MASIDERVVQMTFRSAEFLSGANMVLSALAKLKSSLSNMKGAESGLNGINAAAKGINLSGLTSSVEGLSSKFSALGVIGAAALATIASRAVMAGAQMLKSLTITPIMAGLDIYSTKLNSMQTILANTVGQAGSNIAHVTQALNELNTYSNQTIYRFGDMAHAIGLFTAAGVGIDTSVASIKGLANIAALSGSSTQQASTAMYQLSQAIAAGSVKLEDWNSIVNAGMGGKVFQNALIETARVHGVSVDEMIKKNGSFRLSLQEGWLTSDIMTETLSKFTGDLSAAQLKAMGYTDAQTQAILRQAKAAVDSATKVRTISQLWEVMSDSVATAWSKVWEAVIGNLPQATALLTSVAAGLSKVFVAPVQHLGDLLQKWNELGGRAILINALSDGIRILGSVLKPIGQAFREVFDPMTAGRLVDLTVRFHDFINTLKPSAATIENIHKIFEGLFSGLKIGVDIFKGIVGVIGQVLNAATGTGGGILGLAAKFGTLITNVRRTIESGTGLTTFFHILGTVLSAPVKGLSLAVQGLDKLAAVFPKILALIQPFVSKVASAFKAIGAAIGQAISSGDLSNVLHVINQVLLGGVLLAIRNFTGKLSKSLGGGLGIVDQIKSIFGGLTGALTAMQRNLNAGTLQKIAIAIALLAASIAVMSFIDAGKLAKSLSAMTVMFTQLMGAMAILSKIGVGVFQIIAIAAAMDLISGAILILAGAVTILAQLSWSEIAKGISAIAAMMVILVASVTLMSRNTPGVLSAAAAMILMAVALNIMSGAVALLGNMDWGTLIKGVGTIAALLAIMGLFNTFGGGKNLISTAAAMLILGAALNVMAMALGTMGSMDMASIGKGLLTIAGALIIIAAGMAIMPKDMLVTAAGLLVVSAALLILSQAMQAMGNMSWGEIAASLIVLAGALVIISAAMMLMTGALPGAAALLIISGALAILVPVLVMLGSLSWQVILTSLAALAGVLIVLGLAGILLAPVAPALLAIGAALLLFGAGVLAVGAGVALLGIGLTAIGAAVTVAGAAILSFVTGLLNLIPTALAKIGQGIVQFAAAIGAGGAAITAAFTTILTALLNAIIKVTPLIGQAIGGILNQFLNLINQYAPRVISTMVSLINQLLSAIASNMGKFVQKGADIIVNLVNGIAANVGRIVTAATNAIVAFLNAIASNLGRVVQAGIDLALKFINAVADGLRNNGAALGNAAWNLASAIVEGLANGIAAMAGRAVAAAANLASQVLGALGNVLKFWSPSHETRDMGIGISRGLALGIRDASGEAVRSSKDIGKAVLAALETSLSGTGGLGNIEPVITPVLDLSKAKKGFDDLAAMTGAGIIPVTSAGAAGAISATAAPSVPGGGVVVSGGTTLSFTQNNTSPKALSAAEIYRQTKNQLSVVKGALPALCSPWSRSRTRRAGRLSSRWQISPAVSS
jgi:tape measure domain-containing protein